ncbi:hypothetical protein CCZ01_04265 [Helicobacter monodelphidis]|uniref:hypothetical protein n=1 Tax=Helicobacter sp. 15-1451 TaxID=2004995 RepID=UPI000DCF184F|nr:hypothetical protein [Helicobacter sp. 15-1451]RAX58028.1 hypothetical protein CCZ01_04265 [Helicobacter sp. 15-1451]
MPVPFILGLVIGGGAVLAYNKRKEIVSLFKEGDSECRAKDIFNKSKNVVLDVKDTILATSKVIKEKKNELSEKRNEAEMKMRTQQESQSEGEKVC